MNLNKQEGKELIGFIVMAVGLFIALYGICWISSIVDR
jgi:hypothetical protein